MQCQKSGHLTNRWKAGKCDKFANQELQAETAAVSIHALKTAETAVLVAAAAAAAVDSSEVQSEGTCECFGVCCDINNIQFSHCSICGCFFARRNLTVTTK